MLLSWPTLICNHICRDLIGVSVGVVGIFKLPVILTILSPNVVYCTQVTSFLSPAFCIINDAQLGRLLLCIYNIRIHHTHIVYIILLFLPALITVAAISTPQNR